jgi:outer membrane protein OmpA-like peptidoglycan-associated protein
MKRLLLISITAVLIFCSCKSLHKTQQGALIGMKSAVGAEVKRAGEEIDVTFGSGMLFPTKSAELNMAAKNDLAKLTEILNKYPDTYIHVKGYTDNNGTTDHNPALSEKRAKEVSGNLVLKE